MSVRVRFAPSPTGQVHIGNIRAAIFNWLFARHEGGKFLLRIEDTDRERSTPEAVKTVLDAMSWLGLDYDEEPLYQSTRQKAHMEAAEQLLKSGHAYKEDKGGTGKGECIVFRMPGEDMMFSDVIKGDLRKSAKDMSDFVIVRSDGTPTFHLANVLDDIEMKITHIIRGDDHVENTFRHIALFRSLQADVPKYGHLPMIINQQGKPYSKRDGAAFVGEFREKGYLASALFNYLTLLGWSPGDDREKLTRDELISSFTLDRVKSGPAQMDIRKLTHLNAQYIAELPIDQFCKVARDVVVRMNWGVNVEEALFIKVCKLMQSRTHTFSAVEDWKYFFSDNIAYDEKSVKKTIAKEGVKSILILLKERLAEIDFSEGTIEKVIRGVEKENGIGEGKLNQPIRVAVTGVSIGAGIYETMVLLGKNRTLAKLEYVINNLCI
ncbi:MAG: glutamate--tRNA ligase [Kiritimatiellae bacterium]|nr:glutamate--tRNA ligase [Kiritimatiellia bacterium]MDD5521349.1 glutamate--tRNA ligase [Kiritimatiellia bacterium]